MEQTKDIEEILEPQADSEIEEAAEADEAEVVDASACEEKPAEDAAEEPVEAPVDELAEEPAETPVDELAELPADEAIEDATEKHVESFESLPSRSDAKLTYLFGIWSIILCITIFGSPFAAILGWAGKKVAKMTEEDFAKDPKGRKGLSLCKFGFVAGIIIFAIAFAGAGFLWFKLRF